MISDVLADAVPELDGYLSDDWPGWRPDGELLERVLDLRARMIGLRLELDTSSDDHTRYAVLRGHSVVGRNLHYVGATWLAAEVDGDVYLPFGSDWLAVPLGASRGSS